MYLKAINATLAAWVVGLFADANIRLGDRQGFLCRGDCACAGHGALYPQRTEKEVRNGEPF